MKRIKMCLCVLAVMICLTGCESLRFEPGQLQKQNAYLHDRATNIAAETARVEKSSEKLQKLTRLTAQQSRAFVSYMGLPDKLPRAVMAEEVLVESSFQIAEQAEVDSQRRFDGWQVAGGGVRSGQQQGIKIVFSPLGMKADLVLLRLAEKYGSGLTVVTDDGELRHKVQRHHAVTIGSLEFYDQMMVALMAKEKGLTGEDEDLDDRRQTKSTKKKGNPRRLSRKERRKAKRIKSL